jgi:uracil-DNA glycosylase family 4
MTDSLEKLDEELIACRRCPRLVAWREKVALVKRRAYRAWDYWGKPVPGFGDPHARVLAVGLAPGAHGSNRTGRMFTGDASGKFLYAALYRAGFASRPDSRFRNDGLTLTDLYVTAVCRCAPPENKPSPEEMINCRPYLLRELDLIRPRVIVALGRIAFDSILRLYSASNMKEKKFYHGATYSLGDGGLWLVSSYHPSQQNTLTGKLTVAMFDEIWAKAKSLANRQLGIS